MKITTDSMQLINVERIKDTKNIRDVKDIDELVASINAHGLINPITVTEEKDGYRLIAGFRRFAAMKQLGAKEIPCVIRNSDKDTLDEISLSENIT
ncbi:MAG: ParB N-terminal domain-containing protein, partial [Bacteroidales bacterium]|nr:ParB N-terminal domain-containing protein [Bacteroidales bacterium]